MIKLYRYAAGTLLAVSLCLTASAQSDSTYLDLGRTKVRRDLTQHITIKGKDLEKLAFTDLSEAISSWFYGRFSREVSFIYVIDGSLLHDVNTYNIQDIEEVTFIQNALMQLNGVHNAEQLVLVTTRRKHAGGTGITAAAQTGLISREPRDFKDSEGKSINPLYTYNRYTVAVQKQRGNRRLGLSASLLRDENPGRHEASISWYGTQPSHINNFESHRRLNRTSVNGFMSTPLGENHTLMVSASYTYQSYFYKNKLNTNHDILWSIPHNKGVISTRIADQEGRTHIVGTEARLSSDWGSLRNTATLTQQYDFKSDYLGFQALSSRNAPYTYMHPIHNPGGSHILFRNHLQYDIEVEDWTIEPAVNISFRRTDHLEIMLTPSVTIYDSEKVFQMQAGFLTFSDLDLTYNSSTNFPFVFASSDLVQLVKPGSRYNWKVYASYANSIRLDNYDPSLSIFQSTLHQSTTVYYGYRTEQKTQRNVDLGSSLSFMNSKFAISYNFNNRLDYSFPYGYFSNPTHWIGVNYKAIDNHKVQWNTQFTVFTNEHRTTSGWANRIDDNKIFAGFDITTHIKEPIYEAPYSGPFSHYKYKSTTTGLQNFYAGYKVRNKGAKQLEVYIFGNNLLNTSPNKDWYRKYYGIGGTFTL
jgi:hypothetical protein